MDRPTLKDSKGMIIDGVFSSEAIDSSGEIVKLDGIDISSMEEGTAAANYEHKGPEAKGFGREIVGRIIYVHKVFKADDCEDDRQRMFYKKVGQPFLYGVVRLLDAAGHSGAEALAAQIRDAVYHDDEITVRYSVEGTTLEKEVNVIKSSIARKVALTIGPCNKTCFSGVIQDPNAPKGYSKEETDVKKSELLQDPENRSIGNALEYQYNPIISDSNQNPILKLVTSLKLLKTMTAGNTDAAPSTLTGGAALQREEIGGIYKNHIVKAIKEYKDPWDQKKFKTFLKFQLEKADLPEVSDSFLDHFIGIAHDYQLKKNVDINEEYIPSTSLVGQVHQLEGFLVDLRKSVRDELEGFQISLPEIYMVKMKVGPDFVSAGRFMVANGCVHHLEDYHGILETLVPEGPLDIEGQTGLEALKLVPEFSVTEHQIPEPVANMAPGVTNIVSSKMKTPDRASIFEYIRPGMTEAHIVEFSEHGAALDGEKLTPDELSLILDNVQSGLATLKWRGGQMSEDLAKGEMGVNAATGALRAAVASGHVHPDIERAFNKHVNDDSTIPGVGNKYAWSEFQKQKKPGVYASLDINSFKHLNDTHGRVKGDSAMSAVGSVLKDAAKNVGTVKMFRHGGDKLVIHAPTQEDIHRFLREARSGLTNIPPVGGVHKPSFSVGLGQDFETADKALLEAKKQKIDPVTGKRMFHPARTPNLGHSLVPGSEGAIQF
jgi:GGDEF domain-containing protein